MDRYQKVERQRSESAINENEIRITSMGVIRNYISYATSLLQEKRAKEIVLKAMGQAISKAVAIAEILKKRNPGLYQDIVISSVSITDVWEPIEEGLDTVKQTRHVSMISVTLSTKELNRNSPGYQPPLQVEQPRRQLPQQQYQEQQIQPRQYQNQAPEDYYGRGRGRGRGRGSGRGGYGGYGGNGGYGGGYGGYGGYENGGNWNWGPGGGRGRGGYYRGAGYERGRGVRGGAGAGRGGYGRGRGRMMGGQGSGNQAE